MGRAAVAGLDSIICLVRLAPCPASCSRALQYLLCKHLTTPIMASCNLPQIFRISFRFCAADCNRQQPQAPPPPALRDCNWPHAAKKTRRPKARRTNTATSQRPSSGPRFCRFQGQKPRAPAAIGAFSTCRPLLCCLGHFKPKPPNSQLAHGKKGQRNSTHTQLTCQVGAGPVWMWSKRCYRRRRPLCRAASPQHHHAAFHRCA